MSNSHNPPTPTTSHSYGSPTSITSDPLALKYSTMPPANRLAGRNVHIYDANDRTTALGGLILNSGVTNDNFYVMIDIFVEFERRAERHTFSLEHRTFSEGNESRVRIQRNHRPLQPGDYCIVTSG